MSTMQESFYLRPIELLRKRREELYQMLQTGTLEATDHFITYKNLSVTEDLYFMFGGKRDGRRASEYAP